MINKEWMKDAFGTPLGENAIYCAGKTQVSKAEVVGATEHSIRFGLYSEYADKHYTTCYNRGRVALYEKGNKNDT